MIEDKILIAAESASTRSHVEDCLSGLDAELLFATSGNRALELISEEEISIVLTALALPDMGGMELAGLIHGDQAHQHIPIVLMTQGDEDTTLYLGHEMGVLDRVELPIRRGALRSKLQLLLARDGNRKRLQEEVQRLELSNQAYRDFAFAASHDLQAPLRAVRGFLSLAEEVADDDPEAQRRYMVQVQSAITRMQTLVTDLLNYSRLEAEPCERSPVDLNRCLKHAIGDMASEIRQYDARIAFDRLPIVTGNESQLQRVFQNLLGNALKYRKAAARPEIAIRASQEAQGVRVRVEDNGMGFDMERATEIFVPFRRLVSPKEIPGSGIGLAAVKKILDSHKGTIVARSAIGQGSTFEFFLPMNLIEVSEFRRTVGEPDAASPESKKVRVLVVDDYEPDRALAVAALESHCQVIQASSVDEALASLESQIDIVLSDYRLGPDDGLALLSAVKEKVPTAKRFLMTGQSDDACSRAVREQFVEEVFLKPVAQDRLLRALMPEPQRTAS